MARGAQSLSLLDVVLCGGGALTLILLPILTSLSRDSGRNRACVVSVLVSESGQRRIHWDFSEHGLSTSSSYVISVPSERITTGAERMTFCLPERREGGSIFLRLAIAREQTASGILSRAQGVSTNGATTNLSPQLFKKYRALLQQYNVLRNQTPQEIADARDDFSRHAADLRKFNIDTGGQQGGEQSFNVRSLVLYIVYRTRLMQRDLESRSNGNRTPQDVEIRNLINRSDRYEQELSVLSMIKLEEALSNGDDVADQLLDEQLHHARNQSGIDDSIPAGNDRNSTYRDVRAEFHRFRVLAEFRRMNPEDFITHVSDADLETASRNGYADAVMQVICMELQEMYPTSFKLHVTANWGGQTKTETYLKQIEADEFDRYIDFLRVNLPEMDSQPRMEPLGGAWRIIP